MMTSKTVTLEEAEALVAKLKAEATANQFSTLENTAQTFADALEEVSYKGEPTVDNEGNQILRIPIEIQSAFIASLLEKMGYNVNAGKKYTNVTRK